MMQEKNELEIQSLEEERELSNPDTIYLCPEPVFLINEAPTAKHLSMANECGVPVVVILSLDKFSDIQERMMWQHMNIPEIDFVCVDWAGDHSNVQFIKNKWRQKVSQRHADTKAALKREYAKKGTGGDALNPIDTLPPFLKNLLNGIRKDGNGPDDFSLLI